MTTIRGVVFPGDFDLSPYPGLLAMIDGPYDEAAGHGFASGPSIIGKNNSMPDLRLTGHTIMSSFSQIYRLDLDNGIYVVRCATGHTNTSSRTTLAITNDDDNEIDLDSDIVIDQFSVLDASNTVLSADAWHGSNGGLGGGAGTPLIVTKGYVYIYKGAGFGFPRVVWFESEAVDLADATLKTDRTGYTATTTGGITISGSGVVTGLASTSGFKTGMRFDCSTVPAGRTILSVDTDAQITLNDGAGVTAGSGMAVTAGYPVILYEKSPASRFAPITLANGTSDGLVVYEADGVTISPFLTVIKVGGQPWLYYTDTPMPGTSPYIFRLVQPNADGDPHVTAFSLPVVAAPNKLIDAQTRPILAKMLTPNYLRRKNTLDTIEDGKWHGYKGQTFFDSATVYSIDQLLSQMDAYQASAGANKWFHIALATGSGSDDWASDSSGWNDAGFDFKPGLDGGLLVTNASGRQPAITGYTFTAEVCGVQFGLLGIYPGVTNSPILWATEGAPDGSGCWRCGGHDVDAATAVIFENVWFGSLANPANAGDDMEMTAAKANYGLSFNYVGEQLTVRNCRFLGTTIGISAVGCRRVEVLDNEFAMHNDDCIRIGALVVPYGRWGLSGPLDGTGGDDVFYHIARNTCHRQIDIADTMGWTGPNWDAPHWDVIQVQTQVHGFSASGGVTTAGSAVVTGLSDTTGFASDMVFDAPTVPLGCRIASVDSSSQITLQSGTGVAAGTDLFVVARTYTGAIHIVDEDWTVLNKVTTLSVNPDDPSRVGFPIRQFLIPSDPCPIYGSFNNNIAGNSAKRGLDMGNGVSFAEFNSFGGSAQLPSSTDAALVISEQEIFSRNDELRGAPNCSHSRLNISHGVTNSIGVSIFSEDDLIADFKDSGTGETVPSAVMNGPFVQDGDRSGRYVYTIDDTLPAHGVRTALYNIFKPKAGIRAGVQELHLRLVPGDVATLGVGQASSLSAVTDGVPVEIGAVGSEVSWHRGGSETGPGDGIELTYHIA